MDKNDYKYEKAIVVGATGLVGLALVEQLEQTPEFEAITVVVRTESQLLNTYKKVTQLVIDDFYCSMMKM